MQIDWITVSAQIINFLILIYLLKRFLYRPVLEAMAKREKRIADYLTEARQRENKAAQEIQQFHNQQQALERQREALLEQAQRDADQRRQEWVNEARQSVEQTRSQWQQNIMREKADFFKAVRRQTGHAILQGLRRVLTDMADSALEEQLARIFVKRLNNLEKGAHKQWVSVLRESTELVLVATTFTASDEMQTTISEAVSELAGKTVELRFEQNLDAICGIELQTGGQTLGWTLGEYLDETAADLEQIWASTSAQQKETMA